MPGTEHLSDAVWHHSGEEVIRGWILKFVEVDGVPQTHLRHRRVQPDLMHPPIALARVWLTGMPQPVVKHDHRARWPDELLLAGDVVVSIEP